MADQGVCRHGLLKLALPAPFHPFLSGPPGGSQEISDLVGKGGQGHVYLSEHRGKESVTKVVPVRCHAASDAEVRAVRAAVRLCPSLLAHLTLPCAGEEA